jgi:crooked neck
MSSRGAPQAKNRNAAPIQITAEQLLREAKDKGIEDIKKAPTQYITDREELLHYQQGKRKDFEDQIRRQRHHIGTWIRYAVWEASQKEFERSRSVFERALDVDYRNQTLWSKYADMEMKNKFVNHARNIWDRCVTLHPRVDAYWYKYTYMEEMTGSVDLTRQLFERWMKWEPDDNAWSAYVKFEMRKGQVTNARNVFERYVTLLPTCRSYLKFSKWEEGLFELDNARKIFERAMIELHEDDRGGRLLVNFARFEIRCKEYHRARVIFKYALDLPPNDQPDNETYINELKEEYTSFEKRHGDKKGIEDAILENRRKHYEDLIISDNYNYDTWFDYCRLEEAEGDLEKIRDTYERAIANIPPIAEKRFWRRYIYIWINYAVFEELTANDINKTREVYKSCLNIIPNKSFTFGKIWLLAANFEVRQKDLTAARKILGKGIGMCPKENLYKGYIELELQLGEIERCRTIYEKYLGNMPFNCTAWKDFASLEVNLGEIQRARSIYEISISQNELDMPELLWKAFIDFEITEREIDKVRQLYERLLNRTSHVKVWISYAQFEANQSVSPDIGDIIKARIVFNKAYDLLKQQNLKEERVLLLTSWRECEAAASNGDITIVDSKLPRKLKMKRMITAEDGSDLGWEEYYDYQFPDDEKKIGGLKILETAMKWKKAAEAAKLASSSSNEMDIDHKSSEEIDIDNL